VAVAVKVNTQPKAMAALAVAVKGLLLQTEELALLDKEIMVGLVVTNHLLMAAVEVAVQEQSAEMVQAVLVG
jgi:hypothetical protein